MIKKNVVLSELRLSLKVFIQTLEISLQLFVYSFIVKSLNSRVTVEVFNSDRKNKMSLLKVTTLLSGDKLLEYRILRFCLVCLNFLPRPFLSRSSFHYPSQGQSEN